MAIAAVRIKYLDKETNVPTADFGDISSTDILNNPAIELGDLDLKVSDLISTNLQVPNIEIPKLDKLEIDTSITRKAKDLFSSVKDISNYNQNDLNKAIGGLLPDPRLQNAFDQFSKKCKTNGMKHGASLGKPYDPSVNCGGKNRPGSSSGCNVSGFSNVLGKLTNGGYNAAFKDLNKIVGNLVNLTNFGYSMNLCGVFSALTGSSTSGFDGLGNNVLSRAAGAIAGTLNSNKNILGSFDLAGAAAGLHVVKELPGVVKGMVDNFSMPKEIKQTSYANFSERLTGSFDLLDAKWKDSQVDDKISIAKMSTYSADLDRAFKGKLMKNTFSESDLSLPSNGAMDTIATAYKVADKFSSNMRAFI